MRIILILLFMAASSAGFAQGAEKFSAYNPSEDAAAAIDKAVAKASKEKKHVLVQVGGNWCSWCAKFVKLSKEDAQIDSLLNASFVVYHLNYSKENRNLPVLAKYSFPQRFGFPVFLIIDANGKLLHTQNSAYLEEGSSHGKQKVMDFLTAWTPQALDPERYKPQ